MLTVTDIRKTFMNGDSELPILKGVNFTVNKGEFVAIMGPSGSGKSTFMNMLGCLDRPSSGSYVLDGVEVTTLNENQQADLRNQKIGFVFQAFNLLPRISAVRNVELPMLYAGISASERKKRAEEALISVGLKERMDHKPPQMSGGQKQRVAIARSLVNRPAILLADEPTGNLDSRSTTEVMAIFQKLHAQGVTIILVTHELDTAQHAERIVVFKDGVIIKDEKVKERLFAVTDENEVFTT
ncbi:ABC transporter ATP-binding protein [Brevibacillus laterosporus]|uniref:ABC transporter ATP-binding protein n=7 Tax=Brevibacillus laterosporus TaxID=1465 RepID=A0AAP8Q8H1_BRELA|nr:ABC transporter ATP-binding protein [Brevibacillus laterosporus]MCR8980476.1 ABC transporter ATP-binding protein [Brevibacillus laterosporus]MCZ0807631.1 ABC transporter ATP-binding protein [Brevibacillus laterosporus]MCZ0853169.1 ABC transporter ATP-binding protein [Brevibacillus laterosporus]PPA90077.1 ABC transporter ATP-binding protein [Brevibacillus laterosporus]